MSECVAYIDLDLVADTDYTVSRLYEKVLLKVLSPGVPELFDRSDFGDPYVHSLLFCIISDP